MKPFFSVIVPTKNRVDLLKECLDSIFNQTFKDFELIIVDDGSIDGTSQFLNELKSQNIIILNNIIGGDSAGRNLGIKSANGEYICFCDDDDLFLPNYLNDFYNELSFRSFPKNLVLRTNFSYYKENKIFKEGVKYNKLKHKDPIRFAMFNFCSSCVLCIPKPLLNDIDFPTHVKQWQDTYFLLRLFVKCDMIQMDTANYLYRYHERMGSYAMISQGAIEENAKTHISYIKDFYINFSNLHTYYSKENFNKIIATKYLEYSANTFGVKNYKLGWKFFFLSISYSISINNWKLFFVVIRNIIFDRSENYKKF